MKRLLQRLVSLGEGQVPQCAEYTCRLSARCRIATTGPSYSMCHELSGFQRVYASLARRHSQANRDTMVAPRAAPRSPDDVVIKILNPEGRGGAWRPGRGNQLQ